MRRARRIFVRNEAIKDDPREIYGFRIYALACSACFGGMVFGMDTGTIGGVLQMPLFTKTYGLDGLSKTERADLSANIVSTLQAGCFLGAIVAAPITDRWGRKPSLLASAIIVLAGVVLQAAAAGNLAPMYIGRFVAGLGTGAASMVSPLYVAENSPRAIRGALTGAYQLFLVFGIMLSFWINYGCLRHLQGTATYVTPLALQGIPAAALFTLMLFCNESPRFLAKEGRWPEAQRVLSELRALPQDHPYVVGELSEMRDAVGLMESGNWWSLQREMWTHPGNRKRALISIILMICQQMTGVNAINYYAPQIFENLGVTGSSNGLFATGIYGLVKFLGVGVFLLFVADSLGRRRSLLWSAVGQGVCMLYIGLYIRISPPVEGQPVPPAGYVALVGIYLFAIIYEMGWGPACWIYVSEIATARLRATNVSMAAATQWLFNFVVSRAVPSMLVTMGAHGYGTYILFATFGFGMFIFTWFFIPETKGMSLEAMDTLFDGRGRGQGDEEVKTSSVGTV